MGTLPIAIKRLRRIPTERRITVKMVDREYLDHDQAQCEWDGKDATICIATHQSQEERIDGLVHEWAHALTDPRANTHGPAWGRNYAKCYRVVRGE